jgi:ribose/xylose/arabinose/galactoside ABC-type transport system permease subunit
MEAGALTVLAVVRPDAWNFPLFLHIGGAMALVASLVVALYAIRVGRIRGDQPAAQFAFRVLWRFTLPAYIVMRVGAQWIASKEKLENSDASWLGIGFTVSDVGLLLLIIGLVLTGLMARRAKAGTSVAGAGQLRAAGILAGILVAAYLVAIWAMTTKPG